MEIQQYKQQKTVPTVARSFIHSLLRREEEKSERLVAYVRMLLAIIIFTIGVSIKDEIPLHSLGALYLCTTLSILYSLFIHVLIRYRGYKPLMKFISTFFDIGLLTVALLSFGGYRTFKAEAFLLYFLWITLAAFRFSLPLTIFAGILSCSSYLFLVGMSIFFQTIEIGTITESYITAKVSIANMGIRLCFLVSFSVFAIYISRVSQQMIKNTAFHQFHAAHERQEKEKVQTTFSTYVTPQVAKKILNEGTSAVGEKRRVTILFCDVRDFTTLSEQMAAEDVVQLLNEYFNKMVTVLNEHGGILNKYTGDGFLALYGVPQSSDRDEEMAVRSALVMRRVVDLWNIARAEQGLATIRFGIGIHCGEVIVGNIGSDDRKEFTVIGAPVNLASRVEGLNKVLGTDILITAEIYHRVRDMIRVKPQPRMKLKGLQEPVRTYQVISLKDSCEDNLLKSTPAAVTADPGTLVGSLIGNVDSFIKRIRRSG
ncbi:adenylate/guanylate cyclase domain-containing protein [candidate division CSSED10-310 bacterium]|uniref:Adenylate/guanylate cyclase domain-containing protein n=1 Tax=candidate division CSSED10-310 bacterium TaxID=2855610 RepID=A0ABV6Z4I9_UNCC1